MTPETVTTDDIKSQIDEISDHIKSHLREPRAETVRNIAIGIAVVMLVAYGVGRSRGRRSR